MLSKREWIVFAAGAATFHTLSHIMMSFMKFPITIMTINLTSQLNNYAIAGSAVITIALFWWLSKTK